MADPTDRSTSKGGGDAGGAAFASGQRDPLSPGYFDGRDLPSSQCGCGGGESKLVYPLGKIGCYVTNPARAYSFVQRIRKGARSPSDLHDFDRAELVKYLSSDGKRCDAEAVEWTLEREGVPIYVIRPHGPFAADTYGELLQIFQRQTKTAQNAKPTEWVAIPGRVPCVTAGPNSQSIPVLEPELRGICDWSVEGLVSGAKERIHNAAAADKRELKIDQQWETLFRDFLERVYIGSRNHGMSMEERALNYSATDAFQAAMAIASSLSQVKGDIILDRIQVRRNPLSHRLAACCDIELHFAHSDRRTTALQRAYRYMIDVSEVIPVAIGEIRSWSV